MVRVPAGPLRNLKGSGSDLLLKGPMWIRTFKEPIKFRSNLPQTGIAPVSFSLVRTSHLKVLTNSGPNPDPQQFNWSGPQPLKI